MQYKYNNTFKNFLELFLKTIYIFINIFILFFFYLNFIYTVAEWSERMFRYPKPRVRLPNLTPSGSQQDFFSKVPSGLRLKPYGH